MKPFKNTLIIWATWRILSHLFYIPGQFVPVQSALRGRCVDGGCIKHAMQLDTVLPARTMYVIWCDNHPDNVCYFYGHRLGCGHVRLGHFSWLSYRAPLGAVRCSHDDEVLDTQTIVILETAQSVFAIMWSGTLIDLQCWLLGIRVRYSFSLLQSCQRHIHCIGGTVLQ